MEVFSTCKSVDFCAHFLWLQYDLCMTCTTNVKLPILLRLVMYVTIKPSQSLSVQMFQLLESKRWKTSEVTSAQMHDFEPKLLIPSSPSFANYVWHFYMEGSPTYKPAVVAYPGKIVQCYFFGVYVCGCGCGKWKTPLDTYVCTDNLTTLSHR